MQTPTMAQYLKAIWQLQEHSHEPVTVTALTHYLSKAPATVSQTVKQLGQAGLIHHKRYGPIALTDLGQRSALTAVRHERATRAFLDKVLNVPWPHLAEEAATLSAAITNDLAERMLHAAGSPDTDPYGNSIPDAAGHIRRPADTELSSHPTAVDLRITRVTGRDPDLLGRFQTLGLTPGSSVQITRIDHPTGVVEVITPNGRASIGLTVTGHIHAVTSEVSSKKPFAASLLTRGAPPTPNPSPNGPVEALSHDLR